MTPSLARIVLLVLLLATGDRARAAEPARLPAEASDKGSLERVASPSGDRVVFNHFERGQPTFVGVAAKDDTILWKKNAGLRPMVSVFWSADSAAVLVLTDCAQPDAELRAPSNRTASWLLVLDAKDGHLLAQGDLDTAVLELQAKLPEAVGAAHVVDKLTLADGTLSATIKHRGQEISGSCPLARLEKPPPGR